MNTTAGGTSLGHALETLLTPLRAEAPDAWRDAVNRDLRGLTGSDVAFFRISDGSPTRVDPLTSEVLAARDAYRSGNFRHLDPWAVQRTAPGEVVVGSFRDLLGDHWQRGHGYYEELLRPRGITDYLGAQIGTDDGGHVLLSLFNLGRSRGSAHRARARRLLQSVMPALRVGLDAWLSVRPRLGDLGAMVDEVPDAVLLCDAEGRTLHANSALVRLLDPDPDRRWLQEALASIAREWARTRHLGPSNRWRSAGERSIRTSRAAYGVRCVGGDGLVRGDHRDGVLLMVRRSPRGLAGPVLPGTLPADA